MALPFSVRSSLLALTAGALVLAASGSAFAAVRCEAQIMKALAEVSIQESDVRSIKVTRGGGGGKSSTNSSYDAWIRMSSCSGYVMVSMTRSCHVHGTYTKGDCQFSGLPSY